MTPSGTETLTRDVLAALGDAGLGRLALSIDGASAATHDDFRGEVGSFAATMRAARTARALDIPLQVNTTVYAETVDELLSGTASPTSLPSSGACSSSSRRVGAACSTRSRRRVPTR